MDKSESGDVIATQRQHSDPSKVHSHDIFVIGASAGGVPTLKTLFAGLPQDFPGSIFVVVHLSAEAPPQLNDIFDRIGPLRVVVPDDMAPIVKGRIYFAPADRHMLLERDHVRIVRGPKENRHRPAIDPLFRSAAWAYGPRVVGAVLTGYLDDGAAGLWSIKTCGGTTLVQDPADALHPAMPQSALLSTPVDHCVPIDEMAALLMRLANSPADTSTAYRRPLAINTELGFTTMEADPRDMDVLGKLSAFTCPTCRGALWELQDGGLLRYRCHTGHAFSSGSLLLDQSTDIEESLYSALRAVEEKASALRRLSEHWRGTYPSMHADYERKAREMDAAGALLRRLLAEGIAP